MFFEEFKDNLIDLNRPTPYELERYEMINGIKYKVTYTVSKGAADSRIINSVMIKVGD